MGTSVRRSAAPKSSQSLVAAGRRRLQPCGLRTRFPGPLRGSLLGAVWRFTPAPSGKTKCTVRGPSATTGLSTNLRCERPRSYPRTCGRCGRAVDTLAVAEVSDAMASIWLAPARRRPGRLGHAARRLQPSLAVGACSGRSGPVKDLLNGRWLGPPAPRRRDRHPDRALLLARSCSTCSASRRRPTSRSSRRSCSCSRRPLSGAGRLHRHRRHRPRPGDRPLDADGRGAAGAARVARPARPATRPTGRCRSSLGIVGFLIVTAGAFVGGDVVYLLGNMVSRHAFRGRRARSGSARHRRRDRPRRPSPRRRRPRPGPGINDLVAGPDRRHASTRCTPCAPTPAGRWRRAPSSTAASSARGTALAFRADGRARPARARRVRPAGLRDPRRRGRGLRGPPRPRRDDHRAA